MGHRFRLAGKPMDARNRRVLFTDRIRVGAEKPARRPRPIAPIRLRVPVTDLARRRHRPLSPLAEIAPCRNQRAATNLIESGLRRIIRRGGGGDVPRLFLLCVSLRPPRLNVPGRSWLSWTSCITTAITQRR